MMEEIDVIVESENVFTNESADWNETVSEAPVQGLKRRGPEQVTFVYIQHVQKLIH